VPGVLRTIFRTHRSRAIALVAAAFSAGFAESAILALVAHSATAMVDGTDAVEATLGPLTIDSRVPIVLGIAGGLAVFRLSLQLALAYLPARIAADTQARLRHRLFDAYSDASWDVQAEERDGHLQELLTNQVAQATMALLHGTTVAAAGFMFLTLVASAFTLGPVVALLVLAVAASLSALLRPLGKRGRQFSSQLSRSQIDYAGTVGAAVRLAEETFTFGATDAQRDIVRRRVEAARAHFLRAQFTQRLTQGVYQGLVILLLVGGLGGLYASGTGHIASLGSVVLILVRASTYGQQAQVAWQVVQQAAPYLDRLEVEETRYDENQQASGDQPFVLGAPLRLDHVSFSYIAGRPVLEDISLAVEAGEAIGIIGPSGAGKSTLVQLLLRMRTPTEGRLTLGGIPVEDVAFAEWRRHVAYVPQEPRVLDATVADNIRFMRDGITDEQVERAARMAHIHDDIVAMQSGYDTIIGQRADAVSGGQRQRICLARALAGEPTVLVLDEPTSALDSTSEAAIRSSLLELHGGLTMFVVAHRPSLLEICDRVVAIEGGRIRSVERSGPDTLAAQTSLP
jgi:ABC-type multidrug transport system fused ATPase/permease subunit